ncbi:RAV-like factor [Marchantia polymorpha subsp. ruderalis]|uniref:CW-type domain-containing protein n=2 Tax=Marchantia polymorpha TaxID=3197 RepID=A0AAF6BVU7_MARPO|nr:hypothetical protein MARPO_0074s0026 [Marchantia polymorpha]BBN16131.1 hypothetical protein Mp_7g03700 [Marchantia polymorpha subsp. ruderalis]|eukprot:PTQ35034.1 hypothetical protein MARPO_0074s0026 [Marchantia polymorpha]
MDTRMERAGPVPRKVCMNVKCGTSSSNSWKPGWQLRSGRACELCEPCGSVFDQGRFCETFHSDDAGWRTCNACKKRVHCGCIASLYSFVLLDAGGVECFSCATKTAPALPLKHLQHSVVPPAPQPQRVDPLAARGWSETFGARAARNIEVGTTWQPYSSAWYPPNTAGFPIVRLQAELDRPVEGSHAEPTLKGLVIRNEDAYPESKFPPTKDSSASAEHPRGDSPDGELHAVESSPTCFSRDPGAVGPDNVQGDCDGESLRVGVATSIGLENIIGSSGKVGVDVTRVITGKSLFPTQDLLNAGPSTGLSMSIGTSARKEGAGEGSQQGGILGPAGALTTPAGAGSSGVSAESRDLASKFTGLSPYRSRHRQLLPRPYHAGTASPNSNAEVKSNEAGSVRVARPPGQGRGRNQLLPRYWPRITDQELQQITSGDSNATITPLFEKMLSASDAGRIGRLVLPKACAEAYFPAISQPEGLPMKIQDITGKEWLFQFRFWPNNNSRMYVLEGVTPCIQSMQLLAGDTVTFSRLDPEGKLVMGYRRAPALLTSQDPKTATRGTSANVSKGLSCGSIDGLYASTGASLLSVSANAEARNKSGQSDVSDSGYGWSKAEKGMGKEGSMLEALSQVDRKQRGRPLGGKSKRLRLENEDSLELKNSWEEAQELLRPPPSVVPSIVTIEGHEFEEYEEPPIFTKRTIFTSRQSGEQDQWAQCDECGSWRRVPPEVLVTARWTCTDNTWDHKRAMCSAPQELSNDDVDHLLGLIPGEEFAIPEKNDTKAVGSGPMVVETSAGLDALAIAAAMGETGRVSTSPSSPARTTKHPRHRPGCTCIVCIQPPSGKGPKHKQNCLCNVCVTVKRRFKTLMLRRKKRLSEREAEGYVRRKRKDDVEVSSSSKLVTDAGSLADGGSRHESSGGGTVVEGPRRDDALVADISNSSGLTAFGLSFPSTNAGEDALVSKGQIDLNSQPEREEEPTKLGRVSMKQLLQDASQPLDTYLKQQGMTSLFGSQAAETSGAVGHCGGNSEKKSDEQSSSQCQDHSNEEASQTSARIQGDSAGIPNQVSNQIS